MTVYVPGYPLLPAQPERRSGRPPRTDQVVGMVPIPQTFSEMSDLLRPMNSEKRDIVGAGEDEVCPKGHVTSDSSCLSDMVMYRLTLPSRGPTANSMLIAGAGCLRRVTGDQHGT
jgi:hypothetical protein